MSDQTTEQVVMQPNMMVIEKDKQNSQVVIHCETCESCITAATAAAAAVAAQKIVAISPMPPKTVESESQTELEVSKDQVEKTVSAIPPKQTDELLQMSTTDKKENDNSERTEKQRDDDNGKSSCIEKLCSEYMIETQRSMIEIKEKLTDHDLHNVPLVDSESEEDDQLKPLMIDNHTIIDHQEFFNYNAAPFYPTDNFVKQQSGIKDSCSSTDSENSTTNYDRRITSTLSQQIGNSSETPSYYDHDEINKDSADDCYRKSNAEIKEIDMLTPSETPDERMCEEIVEHVEYYFSNENILKDAFLLKHVRRNKEGFVSLKLVSSFKRVRQLTKDWRVVGYAIRKKSRRIELNDLGTKIRRMEALPTFDETMPSRTIVACDLPFDKLCIEKVTEIFSKCGEIALVRILKPGMGIPVDVRQFMNKYPEMQQKECALVEFIESHSARSARNMNGNYQVFEMVAPKKKTGKKAQSVTKIIETFKYPESNYERSRGGGGGGGGGGSMVGSPMENEFKYKMRRNSEYYVKPEQHQQHVMYSSSPQRPYSCNNNDINNFGHYPPRRISNCSLNSGDMSRKYSSCSDGYSSCSDISRRTSGCSTDQSRRTSNCSDMCPCSRRMSGCSDIYRRLSQCSDHRRYSNSAVPYDRSYSNPQDVGRRTSMDSIGNYHERKISGGSMTGSGNGMIHEPYRKFSNGFDPNRKFSNPDQYYNGRKISTDSGYDRKLSFGSDYGSSPRSRSNSFLSCQHKNVENVVRTPIGPDGSKGFVSRNRKLGQIVPPVN